MEFIEFHFKNRRKVNKNVILREIYCFSGYKFADKKRHKYKKLIFFIKVTGAFNPRK